jgi:hypothetical protein
MAAETYSDRAMIGADRKPVRIQLRRIAGWRKPEGAIVVARPSRWGNPFRIHQGHTLIGPPWSVARETWTHIPADRATAAYVTRSTGATVAEAVAQFRSLMEIRLREESDRLCEWLAPLADRDLCCWCPLDRACHADVLLEIANTPKEG